jgi:hypothetical protein
MTAGRIVTWRWRRAGAIAALSLSFSVLTACAHQDLTAPCTRDSWLSFGTAYASDCGPLRPVNPEGLADLLRKDLHEPTGQGAAAP